MSDVLGGRVDGRRSLLHRLGPRACAKKRGSETGSADQLGIDADGHSRKSDFLKDLKVLRSGTGRRAPLFWQRLSATVAQSGLQVEPERVVQIAGTMALLAAVAVITVTGRWPLAVLGRRPGFRRSAVVRLASGGRRGFTRCACSFPKRSSS